jgi:hypothetical protein
MVCQHQYVKHRGPDLLIHLNINVMLRASDFVLLNLVKAQNAERLSHVSIF